MLGKFQFCDDYDVRTDILWKYLFLLIAVLYVTIVSELVCIQFYFFYSMFDIITLKIY